ncbi:hypothetical protein MUK42_37259 [Musa troglodytarum]|uniref:Uncharacterized protein n=1 Tax=Musa troglodytarum TaxID=320322 RepID=A0A9E7KLV7_9LILI|nr:hypothetical protein MUK42_12722 [Musa troglodytarum]URE20659.1 hypothetical protein MUK42_37259 [Musa troglodytarum]
MLRERVWNRCTCCMLEVTMIGSRSMEGYILGVAQCNSVLHFLA